MPQSIISQFQRQYNSPIEVNRQVATATERDAINSSVRWRGMLVHVVADDTTYELVGGVDNGSWQVLGGLQDAPSDGNTYGRKDGAWSIINSGISALVEDTSPQLGGSLQSNGNSILLAFNDGLSLYNSSESLALRLFNNGTNNYIDISSGSLTIRDVNESFANIFRFRMDNNSFEVTGDVSVTDKYNVGLNSGASGTFTSSDSKTITVTGGIITSIV